MNLNFGMDFTERLVSLRKKNGLTQDELAEALGMSRQAVSRWEMGASRPSMDKLQQLSELYDVSADYLINGGAPRPERPVAVMERPAPEKPAANARKPMLTGVVIGLVAALVAALLAGAFFIGYQKGVEDTTPSYPMHTAILSDEDFEEPGDLIGW